MTELLAAYVFIVVLVPYLAVMVWVLHDVSANAPMALHPAFVLSVAIIVAIHWPIFLPVKWAIRRAVQASGREVNPKSIWS